MFLRFLLRYVAPCMIALVIAHERSGMNGIVRREIGKE